MRSTSVAILLCLGFAAYAADQKDSKPDIVVRGKAVTKDELDQGQPVAAFAKDEILAVVTKGKPACKNGTGGADFDGTVFSSDGEKFTTDELLARLHQLKSEQKISCFRVRAHRYDKLVYKRLEHVLVDENQISLFWDEVK